MQTRKRYSKEFKLDAISLVLEQGYSCARRLADERHGNAEYGNIMLKEY